MPLPCHALYTNRLLQEALNDSRLDRGVATAGWLLGIAVRMISWSGAASTTATASNCPSVPRKSQLR